MPVAAFAGRADIMGLVGRDQGSRVAGFGGYCCGHPPSMIAAESTPRRVEITR